MHLIALRRRRAGGQIGDFRHAVAHTRMGVLACGMADSIMLRPKRGGHIQMFFARRNFIDNSVVRTAARCSSLLVAALLSSSSLCADVHVIDVVKPQSSPDAQTQINVRYLAADGNDADDGLTPSTAWRTVDRLNVGLPSGGTALLRCGDVFYGTIEVKGGIDGDHRTVIASYGTGAKPMVSCTKNLRDDPGIWQPRVASAVRYNYWVMELTNSLNYTGVRSSDANPGFLLVDGVVKPWKHFCSHDVNRQWDFAGEDGLLYVYSTNNPALLSHDIRVAVNVHGLRLSSHTAVSNLAVVATGAHGIYAGWSSTPTVDMRISDCVFENIGGSELVNFGKLRVRYGNGVEFGSNCADAVVERCEFRGIYDVAFTMQGSPSVIGWSDIHMRNCVIRDSSQAFEVWCKEAAPGLGFSRCSFTGNRTVNVGGGWGALTRPNRSVATPLLLYRMETDTVDITVAGNVFENVPLGLIYKLGGIDTIPSGYQMHDNIVHGAER